MKNDLQSAIWTFLLFGYDQLISSLVKLIILDKEIFSASHRKSFIYLFILLILNFAIIMNTKLCLDLKLLFYYRNQEDKCSSNMLKSFQNLNAKSRGTHYHHCNAY